MSLQSQFLTGRDPPSASVVVESRGKVQVVEAAAGDKAAWETYIESRDDTTFVDSWRWREVLERSYRLPCYWYLAKRNDAFTGALALTLTRHPLLGTYLATAPFANQGGFYFDDQETASALMDMAETVQRQTGARYVNLRHLRTDLPPTERWLQLPAYASFWLRLPGDPQRFLVDHLRRKTRWEVKQSLNSGFTVEFGTHAVVETFWAVINKAMKELGSPYHSRAYLDHILEVFGKRVLLAVSRTRDGTPAGAALLFFHRDTAVLLHANVLRKYHALKPAEFLYFSVIEECCRREIELLDMGRSLVGSGNEGFKMKWRPERRDLAYFYRLRDPGQRLPALNQANSRLQLAIKAWQRLPLSLHRLVGPRLISGLL